MNPLRVLHVIGGDDTGGAMSYLLPLLTALRQQGCDAHLACLGPGGLAEAAATRDLPHTIIPMSRPWDARVLPPLRRLLAGGGWHVVHTHGMRANLPVRTAWPTMRSPQRPLLFTTIHSDLALDYATLQARAYGLLDRATRPVVDGFCCVSSDLARRLVAGGVPQGRVFVVHPGIEVAAAGLEGPAATSDPPPPQVAAARRPTVGTVARLVPVKDLGLLLDTVALVARRVPEVRAVIVGDGPERAVLEARAAQPDLAGRVEFPGRVVPAAPLLAGFDVFVSSSESEGIPLAVLEAMCAGLPVVATAVGGLPETVQDGITGFVVKREGDRAATAKELAECVVDVLADPDLRDRMGRAGARRVAERFTAQATGALMAKIYERVVAARAAAGGAARPGSA